MSQSQLSGAERVVGIVKQANDIISQLETENAELRKQASAINEINELLKAEAPKIVAKLASVKVAGETLITPGQESRFVQGMQKVSGIVSVLNQTIGQFEKVAAASEKSDAHQLGTVSKQASADESPLARLAKNRVRG